MRCHFNRFKVGYASSVWTENGYKTQIRIGFSEITQHVLL